MALSIDQFLEQLTGSGLLSADEVPSLLAAVPEEQRPKDGEALARELVKQKKLTKFQAEQVIAGKGKSLTLGNYVILDKLGQGGMGMVLKAEHKRMKRLVALKVMSPTAVKTPDSLKRFHREVEAAAKLRHPNIVAADDADEAKGTHFLVMEYVDGSDLSALVKKRGPLPVEQAIRCITQAARGLEYAHEQGVIHRDIKPANLLIDAKGTVKILDMGLARIDDSVGGSSEGAGLTSTGTIMGTVDYMSPEQAMDTKHADARSDIYSLGCSLYYLLTGHVVYDGDTMMKKLMAHQNAPIPDLSGEWGVKSGEQNRRETSSTLHSPLPTLNSVFRRMVAKRPEDRPQSMTEVIAELERCFSGGSPTVVFERSGSSATNVAASGASGSGNELQDFLRQISGGEPATATSGKASGTVVTPPAAEAETMISSAGEGGTDPHTEQTLTVERSGEPMGVSPRTVRRQTPSGSPKRKLKWLVGSIAAAVVVLLAVVFAVRGKSGTLVLEVNDELIKVTLGDTGRTVQGKTKHTLQVPIGELVLHIQRESLEFDTPEFTVTKGEPTTLKIEHVGNRVRVMRDGDFFVAEELSKSKVGGGRMGTPKTRSASDQNFALEFDGVENFVEATTVPFQKDEDSTIEMWARNRSVSVGAIAGLNNLQSKTHAGLWFDGDRIGYVWLQEPQAQMRLLSESPPREWLHVAGVRKGDAYYLFVNGREAPNQSDGSFENVNFSGLLLGGTRRPDPQHFYAGDMREVRVSNIARYSQDFTPPPFELRFQPDDNTVALYHFDEGQGDKLIDSSGNNHHGKIVGAKWVSVDSSLITAVPPPAVAPFDAASSDYHLQFDGDDYVDVQDVDWWRLDKYTLEAFVTPERRSEKVGFIVLLNNATLELDRSNNSGAWLLSNKVKDEKTKFYVYGTSPAELTKRVHLAGVANGRQLRLFVDGKQIGSSSAEQELEPGLGERLTFGGNYIGTIDGIRVSKAVRYDGRFTPPSRFEKDADTLALYHFDEGMGEVLRDSSGNSHHGKIVGAKWVRVDGSTPMIAPSQRLSPYEILTSPDYEWTVPENLGPGVNTNFPEKGSTLSADGLRLIYLSFGRGSGSLCEATRSSLNEPFGYGEPLGPEFSNGLAGNGATLSRDGLTLIFGSWRPGGLGESDLWQTTRPTLATPFGKPVCLTALNSSAEDSDPTFSSDGLTIWFKSTRPGTRFGECWTSRRSSLTTEFSKPVPFDIPREPGETNSAYFAGYSVSADERALLFVPVFHNTPSDLWMTVRPTPKAPFGVPVNLGLPINSETPETFPNLSADGTLLVFASDRPGGQGQGSSDLWMTRRVPKAKGAATTAAPPPAKAPFDAAQARAHQEAWAKHLGTTVETTNSVGAKRILIPPGEFLMGSTDEQVAAALKMAEGKNSKPSVKDLIQTAERPQHRVIITKPFLIGATEVTLGQFRKFVTATTYQTEAQQANEALTYLVPSFPVTDDSPAAVITWNDAVAYCNWLGQAEHTTYRLPTEAEWEYACRAGTTTQFWFGDDTEQLERSAWFLSNTRGRTHPVGTKAANPFGLHDMSGNLWEWCQDHWRRDQYPKFPLTDPSGPTTGSNCVLRGGAWFSSESECRSMYRSNNPQSHRNHGIGFRVVTELNVAEAARNSSTTSATTANQTLDLITLFDIDKGVAPWRNDGAKNQWSREASELKFNADGKPGLVKFPTMKLLDANYRLELEFTRTSGTNGFNFDLPMSSGLFSINLDEGDRGRTGLGKSDQFTDSFRIEPNRRYRLAVVVEGQNQQDSIRLEVDGKPLLAWQGDRQKAAVPTRGANNENTRWPGIWIPARGSSFTIHRLQVLQLSSETPP